MKLVSGIRAFQFSDTRARSKDAHASGGLTRRALLQGATGAAFAATSPAWSAEPITLRAAQQDVEVLRGQVVIHRFLHLRLGPRGRLRLSTTTSGWVIAASRIRLGRWTPPPIRIFVRRVGSGLTVRAEMGASIGGAPTRSFGEVPFDDWVAGNSELRTTLDEGAANAVFDDALPRGASARGDVDLALKGDLGWRATPRAGADLYLEDRELDGRGIRFGLVSASNSPFHTIAPVADGALPNVYAEAETRDDTRELLLGRTGDSEAVADPIGAVKIAVERRDAPTREDLALLEGPAILKLRVGDRVDGPFRAQHLRRFQRQVGEARSSTTLAWVDGGTHSISTGVAPLIIQGASSGLRTNSEDFRLEAENGRLTHFEGRFYAQQLCLSVPGADYSRFFCGLTPLRIQVQDVPAPQDFAEPTSVATLGSSPKIAFALDASRLHVKRFDDLVDLKFGFLGMSLVVEPDRAYLASQVEPFDENKKPTDASALMVVQFPPQHVAERAYYRQENAGSGGPACAPPAVAYMFPSPSDSWFAAFQQRFQDLAAQRGLAKGAVATYTGPASLREHPELAADLRKVAVQALEDVRADARYKADAGDDAFEEITQARLSGPSRLGFRVPYFAPSAGAVSGADALRFEIPLDLDTLTDWRHLDLSVVKRAESLVPDAFAGTDEAVSLSTDTARRLRYLGFRTRQDAGTATERLKDVVAGLQAPSEHETSIELPFRLFLSPHRQGRFLTPRPKMRRTGAIPLWTAELDWTSPVERRGIGEVRAVWSTDFRQAVFQESKVEAPPRGPVAPWELGASDRSADVSKKPRFRTALDAYDRHEIVVLSSVHGLPVLARPGEDGRLTGDQLAPPREFILGDIDTGMPVGSDDDSARGHAIYDPQPLGVRELALSSLGGNLDLDATFEPPYAARRTAEGDGIFPSLSVERWRQRTVLGRDVLVEVLYKGFLFPIGHRCSLVKLTERVFEANPRGGHPTAYLTQRQFLRISKPEKGYPAIGQPFEGRAWPPRSVTVVTRRTPDLVDPSDGFNPEPAGVEPAGFALTPNGRLLRDGTHKELKGLVFWPRTSACSGAEVCFEIRIDGSAESVFMPLLFVDNVAVGDPTTVSDVVRYYNALDPDPKNMAPPSVTKARWDHGGAMRRYATETKTDEASLLSLQWVVGAEGRSNSGGTADGPAKVASVSWEPDRVSLENGDHIITPVMNAADQPPFYPRLRAATVRLQAFERLAGRQVPPVTASYLTRYLRNNFEEGQRHTFMELRRGNEQPISLRFSGEDVPPSGDRGGGVGQPNLTVDAVSRELGPTLLSQSTAGAQPSGRGRSAPIRLASRDVQLAQVLAQGPATASGALQGLLKDAKILGLKLTDLVGAAELAATTAHPTLRETLDFGVADVEKRLDELLAALRKVLEEFDAELTAPVAGSPVDLRALLSLYPDLDKSKNELERALAPGRPSAEALTSAVEPARRFVAALGRAAADPLAPVRDAARDAFRNLIIGLLLPADPNVAALAATISDLKSTLRGAMQRLLKAPDLAVWRRIVLSLPSVRPDLAGSLREVDEAINRIWGEAVDEAFAQSAPTAQLQAILASAVITFRRKLAEDLRTRREALGAFTAAGVRGELERLERSVGIQTGEALARRFGSSVGTIETLVRDLDPAMARDPARLLGHLGDLGRAVLALAATELPLLVSRSVAEVCQNATDALALVTAAALPTGGSRAALERARAALITASDDLARGLTELEEAIRLRPPSPGQPSAWPIEARQLLEAWIERQRNNGGILVRRLEPALEALLEATAEIKPDDLIARVCRDPGTAPFTLLQDLDAARRQTLEALHEIQTGLHAEAEFATIKLVSSDLAALRSAVDRRLRDAAAAPSEAVRQELIRTLDVALAQLRSTLALALKAVAEVSVLALDAASVLGAVSQDASAAQAQAVGRVRSLLQSLETAVAASPAIAEEIRAAIAHFDPAELRKEREALVQAARNVQSAQAAALEAVSRTLRAQVETAVAKHLAATDTAIQRSRAVLLAGSEEIARTLIASLAPLLVPALEAIERVDRQIMAARSAAIRQLDTASNQANPGSKNLAGLAALLKVLPGSKSGGDATRLLACPFVVTATPGAACPDGIDGNLETVRDVVALEVETIRALRNRLETRVFDRTTVDSFQTLAASWQAEGPAAARLVRQLLGLAQDILRGDLGRFIDLAGLRTRLESELRSLLPLRSNLEHSLGLDLDPPGFLKEVFILQDKDPGAKHLAIETKSTIDLFPQKADRERVTVKTEGTLKPFEVKLLGKTLDVATLQFSGATFRSENGGSPEFRISFLSFKPGKAIEFIEPLQRFLSPGETGPRIEPLKRAPGVAAGFGLNLGIISIGTVSFANVVLNAVAELPFDDSDAKFRIGLGRRDAPFLISAFPYTGGGYFAIIATGGQIDGFEASFEFGGGGAFRFGPLSGQGRLTTGIFIRQSAAGAYMDGFFYCGGSARVAFFGVSASLTVRMGLVDGNMAGEAVFEYAFSLGIKDFKFQVAVWRREGKGFTQSATLQAVPTTDHASLDLSPLTGRVPKTLLAMREPIRLAALARSGLAVDATGSVDVCRPVPGAFFKLGVPPPGPYACLVSTAMCQSQDWGTYASYFDSNLLDRAPAR